MTFAWGQACIARSLADDRRRDDAHQQRRTILGDEDAHWLIKEIEGIGNSDSKVRLHKDMKFSFFPEDGEALYDSAVESGDLIVVEMPMGSVISLESGFDHDSWVYRVDNGVDGPSGERIYVAFRALETGGHLLYLRQRQMGREVTTF